jgi:hypothetical protein
MIITLSPHEIELLQHIVRQYYMELRAEIYHTDSAGFKQGLKREEAQLERLLEKLAATAGPSLEFGMWERA